MSDFDAIFSELDSLSGFFDQKKLGSITVRDTVKARNNFGRFTTRVAEADRRATDSAGRVGANAMRAVLANHVKTGKLLASVNWHKTGDKQGRISWGRGADYWRYQAYGTSPHPITGWVSFFWDRRARRWVPGPNTIHHPGNPAVPFVQAAHHEAQRELEDAMRREYALI